LEDKPELAAEPEVCLRVACACWTKRHINHFCDLDDIVHVTRRVNGGLNGLRMRKTYLARAKTALKGEDNVPIIWAGADYGPDLNFA
jgi:putative chitinase